MNIVMLGAGNVATHLSKALQKKGFSIVQVYSRTDASAKALAELLNAPYTTKTDDINSEADIYIYTLKDNALEEIIHKINLPDAIHIHTAGSVNIDVFEGRAKHFGVIYPMQTFSKSKEVNFENIALMVEANTAETTDTLFSIAQQLSNRCYKTDSEQRKKIHLSAVFACNFTNYMYTIAEELLNETNAPFDILQPLIAETAEKIKYLSPAKAQTGPAVRYDTVIIEKHLKMLENRPELQQLYKEISKLIYNKSTTNI